MHSSSIGGKVPFNASILKHIDTSMFLIALHLIYLLFLLL